ncbi:lysoplasmalogenase family protein [Phosphitispora sp. TUW77]|uniref:lysoplasmalogenase family protein n=1 Tax=Phosphitispora sp. TUW77 TaxID=3152361 RepID=UPI003AB640CB
MNIIQKLLLATFLPLTVLFLVLDNLSPEAAYVNYIKFLSIISLCLTALLINKKYPEQKLLAAAMFFVMIGDFFLVFCSTYFDSGKFMPFGILGFTAAYLFVIAAVQKNFKISSFEAAAALPVLAITVPAVIILFPFINGIMRYGLIIFIAILCYCSWICIGTVFRGYFTTKNSRLIALAGFLMLICDLGVGMATFHPYFSSSFVPWLKNIIWGAYVPAWTIIVVTIAEKNLINSSKINS